jgi:dTMP kinase
MVEKDVKRDRKNISTEEKRDRGRLIVFEGADSTGKRTQAKMMLQYLNDSGTRTDYIEFPQYDSPFGALVGNYLRGEFGELEQIPPEIPAILFALDRYQFKAELEKLLSSGTYLIANRYSESNLGYQAAKLTGTEKEQFITWIDELEGRMPRADLVFYLHLPIEVAQKLLAGRSDKNYLKGRKRDIHEQNVQYQKLVSETYLEIATQRKETWTVIDCAEDDGIKNKDRIHQEIIDAYRSKF